MTKMHFAESSSLNFQKLEAKNISEYQSFPIVLCKQLFPILFCIQCISYVQTVLLMIFDNLQNKDHNQKETFLRLDFITTYPVVSLYWYPVTYINLRHIQEI